MDIPLSGAAWIFRGRVAATPRGVAWIFRGSRRRRGATYTAQVTGSIEFKDLACVGADLLGNALRLPSWDEAEEHLEIGGLRRKLPLGAMIDLDVEEEALRVEWAAVPAVPPRAVVVTHKLPPDARYLVAGTSASIAHALRRREAGRGDDAAVATFE